MPPSDHHDHHPDRERDRDRDRDRDKEDRTTDLSRKPGKSAQAASKTKDLSHVPCKFYKVGGCTAGSSCPFSHSMAEPGGQKETCTWFVKGNCKFGHKCALAHVLPGQSQAMDRKNKKAAQAAQAAGGGGGEKISNSNSNSNSTQAQGPGQTKTSGVGGVGTTTGTGGRTKRDSGSPASHRLPLLTGGATAPTRALHTSTAGSRPPPAMGVPLKASISPSAPAPPLKDTDFAAFTTLDEMEGLSIAGDKDGGSGATTAQQGMPTSAPRSANTPKSAPVDFGPIGSPPASYPMSPTRQIIASTPTASTTNAPLPSTATTSTNPNAPNTSTTTTTTNGPPSPTDAGTLAQSLLGTSPFSAPTTQNLFPASSYGHQHQHTYGSPSLSGINNSLSSADRYTDRYNSTRGTGMGGGLGTASSLGSGLAMMGGRRYRSAFDDTDEFVSPSTSASASNQYNQNYTDEDDVVLLGSNTHSGAQRTSSYTLGGGLSAQMAARRRVAGGTYGEYEVDIEFDEDDLSGGVNARRPPGIGRRSAGSGGLSANANGTGNGAPREEENMEEFLPSSLTELLTPEERSRRMSRSQSGQVGMMMGLGAGVGSALSREVGEGGGDAGAGAGAGVNVNNTTNGAGLGHRYSRSVPAPSLLGDLKSIWADTTTSNAGIPASPRGYPYAPSSSEDPSQAFGSYGAPTGFSGSYTNAQNVFGGGGVGTSLGGTGGVGSYGVTAGGASSYGMTSLSPSNKSAAFLPGLHHHYTKAKQAQALLLQQREQQQQLGVGVGVGAGGIGRQLRGVSAGAGPTTHTHTHGGTQTTYRTPSSPFDLTQSMHAQPAQAHAPAPAQGYGQTYGVRGYTNGLGGITSTLTSSNTTNANTSTLNTTSTLPNTNSNATATNTNTSLLTPNQNLNLNLMEDALRAPHLLSPSARALQAHAPGQSLPQGLAAGYSRIHALPPLQGMAVSPPPAAGISSGVGSGMGGGTGEGDVYGVAGEWGFGALGTGIGSGVGGQGQMGAQGALPSSVGTAGSVGSETPFGGRMSYSAAARAATPATQSQTSSTQPLSQQQNPYPHQQQQQQQQQQQYSQHPHQHPSQQQPYAQHGATPPPPGLTRNGGNVPGGAGRYTGPFSPLSGPVMNKDDDDLFDMESG